jgi:hypothetical protein
MITGHSIEVDNKHGLLQRGACPDSNKQELQREIKPLQETSARIVGNFLDHRLASEPRTKTHCTMLPSRMTMTLSQISETSALCVTTKMVFPV